MDDSIDSLTQMTHARGTKRKGRIENSTVMNDELLAFCVFLSRMMRHHMIPILPLAPFSLFFTKTKTQKRRRQTNNAVPLDMDKCCNLDVGA